MTKEQYVDFDTAKLLKEKGFDWECDCWTAEYSTGVELHAGMERRNYNDDSVSLYDGLFSVPTQQMAMRWLREEKGIHIYPIPANGYYYFASIYIEYGNEFHNKILSRSGRKAYEDAIEAALEYVLTNLI